MKPHAIGALLLSARLTGCAPHRYHAAPISPAATATALYSRSLDDRDLDQWMKRQGGFDAPSWPLPTWDLQSLVLAAYYFNPDLDVARANATASDAAITTAAMKPNPSARVGPGYQGPSGAQPIAAFDFSLPIETAGKRGYRIANVTHLSAASRLQLGQTAWTVRNRTPRRLTERRSDASSSSMSALPVNRPIGAHSDWVWRVRSQVPILPYRRQGNAMLRY